MTRRNDAKRSSLVLRRKENSIDNQLSPVAHVHTSNRLSSAEGNQGSGGRASVVSSQLNSITSGFFKNIVSLTLSN
jgi:hypothetical protein